AQVRDVLVANPAVLPAVLNQAHCQPIGRLAKVHEHCSGTIRARFLPSEAGALLAAPPRSWRTPRHSITFVGASEQRERESDAERLGSLKINDQLHLRDSQPCVLTRRQLQLLEPH